MVVPVLGGDQFSVAIKSFSQEWAHPRLCVVFFRAGIEAGRPGEVENLESTWSDETRREEQRMGISGSASARAVPHTDSPLKPPRKFVRPLFPSLTGVPVIVSDQI